MGATLGILVLGGTVGVMTTGLRTEPKIAERSADIQGARVAMDRLTRELRQGASVVTATETQLILITNVNSATCGGASSTEARQCRVSYTCTAGTCSRTEANPDGSGTGPSQIVVEGIGTGAVFSYAPSSAAPTFVGVKLEFPSNDGEDAITLTDGVTMRSAVAPAS